MTLSKIHLPGGVTVKTFPPPPAGFDPLEHEGRDYARALMDAGVPADHLHYSALVHDFFIMGDVSPAVVLAAKDAAAAIRASL